MPEHGVEYQTPADILESARLVMGGIDLDPATSEFAQEGVKAKKFYTRKMDGLEHEWTGNIWLNPPWSAPDIQWFVEKLLTERFRQAILLCNSATDTKWWHNATRCCNACCFSAGRVRFNQVKNGIPHGKTKPARGVSMLYFGKRVARFNNEFKKYGVIMSPANPVKLSDYRKEAARKSSS